MREDAWDNIFQMTLSSRGIKGLLSFALQHDFTLKYSLHWHDVPLLVKSGAYTNNLNITVNCNNLTPVNGLF